MKKLLLLLLTAPCSVFAFAADYDPGVWVYQFHFEIKEGVVRGQAGRPAYEASPAVFLPDTKSPKDADYRIDIVSGKGVMLGSFGFNDPKTFVPALNASVFDVETPFFANGGRALVYDKFNTKQLEISLAGSSFCNDNNKCDTSVGETYFNCTNDCPPPVNATTPPPSPTPQPEPRPTPTTPPTPEPVVSPTVSSDGSGDITVTRTGGGGANRSKVIPMTIGVGVVLLAIVGLIWWRKRGTEEV